MVPTKRRIPLHTLILCLLLLRGGQDKNEDGKWGPENIVPNCAKIFLSFNLKHVSLFIPGVETILLYITVHKGYISPGYCQKPCNLFLSLALPLCRWLGLSFSRSYGVACKFQKTWQSQSVHVLSEYSNSHTPPCTHMQTDKQFKHSFILYINPVYQSTLTLSHPLSRCPILLHSSPTLLYNTLYLPS